MSLLLLTITINQKTLCMKLNEICMILKRKDGDCRTLLCVCVPATSSKAVLFPTRQQASACEDLPPSGATWSSVHVAGER